MSFNNITDPLKKKPGEQIPTAGAFGYNVTGGQGGAGGMGHIAKPAATLTARLWPRSRRRGGRRARSPRVPEGVSPANCSRTRPIVGWRQEGLGSRLAAPNGRSKLSRMSARVMGFVEVDHDQT